MNLTTFFAYARRAPFGGRLTQAQIDGMTAILKEWDKRKLLDNRWLAYMLATAFHETGGKMQPLRENMKLHQRCPDQKDLADALSFRGQRGGDCLRVDFQHEKGMAHESRSVIHQRLDNQAREIAHLEKTIAVSGEIDAQVRGEIQALKETVEKNQGIVAPAIDEWKRMKTLGVGISGLIALAGLTIGDIVAYMSETAVSGIRHWLKIQ